MKYVFAVLALALAGGGLWTGLPAYRAAHAAPTPCDYRMAAQAPGTWVTLQSCAADLFHQSTLSHAPSGQARQLMALRPAGESAELPATVALAVAPAQMNGGYRIRPRNDIKDTADLLTTLGVVMGRLKTLPLQHTAVPSLPTGLDDDPVVVALSDPPPSGLATFLLGCAAVAAGLSVYLFLFAPARHLAADRLSSDGPTVRWGLVFTLVLVGVVGLARGLQWYFDPLRMAEASYSATPNVPAAAPVDTRARPPSEEEIAGLLSSDPATQHQAVQRLVNRPVTPAVVAAIDEALARQPQEQSLVKELVCLRCADTSPGSLDALILRFPDDPTAMRDARTPGVGCVAATLAARVQEDPERITAVFMRTLSLENGDVRFAVLKAFRALAPMEIPDRLILQAIATDGFPDDHARALTTVVAMGAIQTQPRIVLQALSRLRSWPSSVVDALADDPHTNGARIVARLIADGRLGLYRTLAFRREATHHDLSAALVEVVGNPVEPLENAKTCLAMLVELKDVRAANELRRIRASLPDSPFAQDVDKTIAALEALPAGVRRALMHELPPRGTEWR